ncbi:TMV resistance protein N-like [Pyrus x bretschneideri]|uniref:TMV resistance protein N-like n=1 Tax=Pyrus x bretschneideri TaxID=225117 RepID=UPI00202EE57D|nr:TMV resistance protein N-like [Pyrus x bretschneideri]
MEIENKEENRRKRNRSGDDDDTDCEGSKARRQDVVDIASSSSSTADADDTKKYDVFISFRGEDTRRTFTSHLHAALREKKITTFIDDKLESGDEIAPALLKAIEESELSVIIFSKDYASSTWCLDELVHILACKEKHGQLVIPIFYDTLPSDVRKQRGGYEIAFAQLEQRFQNSIDKVHKWRDALTKAANISGVDSEKFRTDADLVKKVVEDISTKLCRASSRDLKGFVGIESRIKQVESLLGIHSSDACITVGIWGMGGIGKTTLAETIFHKLSSKFEASCFVKNVRENSEKVDGLDHLEKTLLKEILKEEGLSIRSTIVQKRLRRTKVLIVLDDVSSSMQIERLAGDPPWYGTGSIIIITTRDRGTLGKTVKEDNIYKVEVLKPDDALQLFCSRAFKNNSTRIIDCKELAEKAVAYAKGLPLALTVLGSLFFNCKSKEEWEDVFNKLKRFPSEDIQEVLRISYDRLGENEKEIFLDIACFHTGEYLVEVKQMLDARGFFATDGIRILKDMSLISIDSELETIPVDLEMDDFPQEMDDFPQEMGRETIEMHDLLQEMGGKIVQEQGNKDPGKRSRLFNDGDVYRVLSSNMILVNLQVIDLSFSKHLTKVPNLSGSLKIVKINLRSCKSLVEIPSYFQHLDKLIHLNLGYCRSLKYLPKMPGSIQYLDLECTGIKEVPESVWSNENISYLNLTRCRYLKKLPSSRCKLKNLEKLDLGGSDVENLPEIWEPMEHLKSLSLSYTAVTELPSSICKLKYLESLDLTGCYGFSKFPEILKPMEQLVSLCLVGTALEMLPSSIGNLNRLQDLNLGGCKQLKDVPTSISSLTNLKRLKFNYCWRLEKLPSTLCFRSLEELKLIWSGILEIPASIKQASRLSMLDVQYCRQLQSIPELPVLCDVNAQGCTSLKIVSSSRTALTQGWDKPNYCCRIFTNCPKLDNNSRSNIMDEAQIAIMRMASVAPFEYHRRHHNPWPQIKIAYSGKEIPNWFNYQNEGSSVDIELCPDWFRTGLFGFALSIVIPPNLDNLGALFSVRANFIVKFMGESHELFSSKYIRPGQDYTDGQHHVHVWNEAFRSEEVGKNCSPDVYILAKEASVVFCLVDWIGRPASPSSVKVESCGICPLYAEDAEKFNFGHVFKSRGPKVEEETRQDDDSKGRGSSDESEANDSD